jgi:hypothetical protein
MEALTVAAASAAVTKIIDFIRNSLGKTLEPNVPKAVWNAGALILGVVGAFVFDIEPVQLAGVEAQGAALKVLTGLAVGGLASGWHELFSALSSVQKKNQKEAGLKVT